VPAAPTDDALTRALAALSGWLGAAGVPYAVIGGVAVSLQASPRYTQDVDAVVWLEDAGWPALVAAAADFGIRPRIDDVLAFAAQSRVLLLSHDGGVPVDVSCGALPFERELVQSASVLDVGGIDIRVARPEHLLVLKAIADRPRDHADIDSLLRAHPDLDRAAARRVVVEFAEALEQPDLVATFDRLTRQR
jgi:Nucleotidyl transferase of unknown function (DUF2204)